MIKENQILVVIKEPGQEPYVDPLFDNTLGAFQKAVDGYIESVTLTTDMILIVNEEGRINDMPYNVTVCGLDLYGPVIAVGVKGEEFASLKSSYVPYVRHLLRDTK